MNKETLMKIKKAILEKQERLEVLEKNAKTLYDTIWDCLVNELDGDIHLNQSYYNTVIFCKEDNDTMKYIQVKSYDNEGGEWINCFVKGFEVLKEDIFNLLNSDKLEITQLESKDNVSAFNVAASSRKMLEYGFLEEGKTK